MTWLVIAQVVGGAVLFLLGMKWLSQALRAAAGDRLRSWLTAATSSRSRGLLLGTSVGFLAHSTAATSMTVGFVHAGLLSLAASLPVLFGANIGTTLSMQLISFRLADYALVAVAVGGSVYLATSPGLVRRVGEALLGFGLLFFGMKVTGDAIVPYRDSLAPLLAPIDGTTVAGMLTGVALSAIVTLIVQSSGAVIGMSFVLADAGVFTSLWQVYPVVLGAHVGTTSTAVVASLGTAADARRAALANVLFNVGNATLGMLAAGLFVPLLQGLGGDLVRQTANAHTFVMLVAAILVLPFSRFVAGGLQRFLWPREPQPASSHLNINLLATPEDALQATAREIGRCAALTVKSHETVLALLGEKPLAHAMRAVRRNEGAIDEIRTSVIDYLRALARRPLSLRQALLAQSLHRCIVEVERIGDHVERLAELAEKAPPATDDSIRPEVIELAQLAGFVVERVAQSWTSEDASFDQPSWATLDARSRYLREATPVKQRVTQRLSCGEVQPERALAFSEFAATLDRLVRHAVVIAQEQRQPSFALRLERLGQPPGTAEPPGEAPMEPLPGRSGVTDQES